MSGSRNRSAKLLARTMKQFARLPKLPWCKVGKARSPGGPGRLSECDAMLFAKRVEALRKTIEIALARDEQR